MTLNNNCEQRSIGLIPRRRNGETGSGPYEVIPGSCVARPSRNGCVQSPRAIVSGCMPIVLLFSTPIILVQTQMENTDNCADSTYMPPMGVQSAIVPPRSAQRRRTDIATVTDDALIVLLFPSSRQPESCLVNRSQEALCLRLPRPLRPRTERRIVRRVARPRGRRCRITSSEGNCQQPRSPCMIR